MHAVVYDPPLAPARLHCTTACLRACSIKAADNVLTLTYLGEIVQSTEEDWKEVRLVCVCACVCVVSLHSPSESLPNHLPFAPFCSRVLSHHPVVTNRSL
jgi:hypothetical protein